jgi:hypothetical protein
MGEPTGALRVRHVGTLAARHPGGDQMLGSQAVSKPQGVDTTRPQLGNTANPLRLLDTCNLLSSQQQKNQGPALTAQISR